MTPTILVLLGGLGLILVGIGLLGTLLGVRATLASFGDLEIGLIMAGYYAGYIAGTVLAPRLIRNVGHIRCFAAFAALASAATLGFGLLVNPYAWLGLRVLNGVCVVGLYMVVESWINEQTTGPGRGRVFALYMMSTLVALALGQTLLLAGDSSSLTLFAFAAVLISLGVIPVAVTRVTEPRIDVSMRVRLPQLLRASPLGVMGALSAGTVNGAFWGMAPVFGQRLPLEEPQIVQLMSATIIGGALLQWPIGHLSDRLDRRIVLILTSLATATVALFAGYVVIEGQSGLIPYAFLYGGLMFSLYGISVAHTNDQLEQGQALEATRGLLLIYGVGALCGPVVAGLAMEVAGPVGLPAMSAATAGLLALFGLYRMARRSAPPVADQTGFVALVRTSPVVLEMLPAADQSGEIDSNPPAAGR
jgi:MFS family permease